jgi:hypothetical protein
VEPRKEEEEEVPAKANHKYGAAYSCSHRFLYVV